MVIEYMDHDLTGLIGMHGKWLAEEHIKCFVKQLIEGLFHCHSRKVLHRDVKGTLPTSRLARYSGEEERLGLAVVVVTGVGV